MTLALAAALLAAPASLPSCSWDRPGVNPFTGDVVAAVDRYKDIPEATRAKLKQRMAARQYDEIVVIRRDAIVGKASYGAEIRDMHFGRGQVCGTVTRARWAPNLQERGLVYCEDGECILVPTICRNVSRIVRKSGPAVGGVGPSEGGTGPSANIAMLPAGNGADGLPGAVALGAGPTVENAPESFGRVAGLGAADAAPPVVVPMPGGGGGQEGGSGASPLESLIGGGGAAGSGGSAPLMGGMGGGAPFVVTNTVNNGTPPAVTNPAEVVTPIPEPGTWAMMAAGLVGLLGWRRWRRDR